MATHNRPGGSIEHLEVTDGVDDEVSTVFDVPDPSTRAVQRVAVDRYGNDSHLREAVLEVVVSEVAGISRIVIAMGYEHDGHPS